MAEQKIMLEICWSFMLILTFINDQNNLSLFDSVDYLYAPLTYTKIAGFMLLRFMGILVVLMKNYKCPWNKSALPSCLYRNNLSTSHRQFIRRESTIKVTGKKELLWHLSVMCLILRVCADGYADVSRQRIIFPSSGLFSRVVSNFQEGLEVAPSLSLLRHY